MFGYRKKYLEAEKKLSCARETISQQAARINLQSNELSNACLRCAIPLDELRDRFKNLSYMRHLSKYGLDKRKMMRFLEGRVPSADTYLKLIDLLCDLEGCNDYQDGILP